MQQYPKHYCGVFGIFGHPNAAELTYYGLYALQHRGQESAGIVTSDGRQFRAHKGMGLVSQIFKCEEPVVEERGCPMASEPTRRGRTSPLKIWETSPMPLWAGHGLPSD